MTSGQDEVPRVRGRFDATFAEEMEDLTLLFGEVKAWVRELTLADVWAGVRACLSWCRPTFSVPWARREQNEGWKKMH